MLLKDFQLAGAHAVEHCHYAGLDAELRVFWQHVEALRPILFSECDTRAL